MPVLKYWDEDLQEYRLLSFQGDVGPTGPMGPPSIKGVVPDESNLPPTAPDGDAYVVLRPDPVVPATLIPVDPWHIVGAPGEPAFQNGWAAVAGEIAPAFTKDPAGRVWMKGMMNNGTFAAPSFTLPVGYRPPVARGRFSVQATAQNAAQQINVQFDGSVMMYGSDNQNVSLDQISFDTETVTEWATGPTGPQGPVGPQGPGGTASIAARMYASAFTPSTALAWQKVPINTISFDTLGNMASVANGSITIQQAGYYKVDGNMLFSTGGAAYTYIGAAVYKNGGQVCQNISMPAIQTYGSATVSDTVYCNVGDFLELYALNTQGTGLAGSGPSNYLTVTLAPQVGPAGSTGPTGPAGPAGSALVSFYTRLTIAGSVVPAAGVVPFDSVVEGNAALLVPGQGYQVTAPGVYLIAVNAPDLTPQMNLYVPGSPYAPAFFQKWTDVIMATTTGTIYVNLGAGQATAIGANANRISLAVWRLA